MRGAVTALCFVARHSWIVPLAAILGCVLWTIAYVFLLIVAIVWNQGVGGPLAYPAGIIAVVGASMVLGWGVFAPASAIGAVCCRVFRLPNIAAIPVVFVSAFVLSYFFYAAYAGLANDSIPSVGTVLKNFVIFLSVPLGVYWWLTEGPTALFDAFHRWAESRIGKSNARGNNPLVESGENAVG